MPVRKHRSKHLQVSVMKLSISHLVTYSFSPLHLRVDSSKSANIAALMTQHSKMLNKELYKSISQPREETSMWPTCKHGTDQGVEASLWH